MKFLFSLLVFVLALSLSPKILAESGHEAAPTGHAQPKHRDNNALFPHKEPNKALATYPGTSQILEPSFMQTLAGTEATLKWKEVEGAPNYHLQVATDPNFKWLKVNESLFQGNTYTVQGLEAGHTYYWRVAAVKPDNSPGYIKGEFVKSTFKTK